LSIREGGLDAPLRGAQVVFELGGEPLDRVEVGGAFRQEEQFRAGLADGWAHRAVLVAAKIVHHHDIAAR
jgi:hypothetical protein